jgi:ribonuclease P protein component
LNTSGADRLASSAAKAAINMDFERRRIRREFVFLNRTHQVDSSAWAIVLVAGEDIGGTGFEAEAAMHTGKELLLFRRERRS